MQLSYVGYGREPLVKLSLNQLKLIVFIDGLLANICVWFEMVRYKTVANGTARLEFFENHG